MTHHSATGRTLPSLRDLDIGVFLAPVPHPARHHHGAEHHSNHNNDQSPAEDDDDDDDDKDDMYVQQQERVITTVKRSSTLGRKLTVKACLPCKTHHVSCQHARPCGRCIDRGREEQCVDVPSKRGLKARQRAAALQASMRAAADRGDLVAKPQGRPSMTRAYALAHLSPKMTGRPIHHRASRSSSSIAYHQHQHQHQQAPPSPPLTAASSRPWNMASSTSPTQSPFHSPLLQPIPTSTSAMSSLSFDTLASSQWQPRVTASSWASPSSVSASPARLPTPGTTPPGRHYIFESPAMWSSNEMGGASKVGRGWAGRGGWDDEGVGMDRGFAGRGVIASFH